MEKEKDNGWVKLHRKFTKWGWYQKSEMVHLFLHFLLTANHEDGEWQGNKIKRGQFITGLHSLQKDTGISIQKLRTCMEHLKSTSEITIKTTNKFRIITIVKYDYYQQDDRKATSKLTYNLTNNQQTTNNKQEIQEDKNKNSEQSSHKEIVQIIDSFENVNSSFKRWYSNKTQRGSCERMLETHGLEQVLKVVAILPRTNTMSWVATITTPSQLEDKWDTLKAQLLKLKNKSNSNDKKREFV